MATTPGTPYPHQVWLTVSLAGLSVQKGFDITTELNKLADSQGHTYASSHHCTVRYKYARGKMKNTLRDARRVLHEAGVVNPMLVAFVVWRVEFRLKGGPSALMQCGRLGNFLGRLPNVLSVLPGAKDDGTCIILEIEDKPSEALMQRGRKAVASYNS
jgi:hypothetical protein